MSNINLLTKYLNPRKYKPFSQGKNQLILVKIDSDFVDADGDYTIESVTKFYKNYPIEDAIEFYNTYEQVYYSNFGEPHVEFDTGNTFYYFKKNIDGEIKYLSLYNAINANINDFYYQSLDDQGFIEIPILASQDLFYNRDQKNLFLTEEVLPEIVITAKKTLSYNPKDLGGLTSKQYELDYKDASGYNNGVIARELNKYSGEIFASSTDKRIVNLTLNPQKGELYWYPEIHFDQSSQKVSLFYDYHPRENDDNDVDPFREEFAIKIEFHYPESFFAFMTLTYFANGITPYGLSEDSGFRKENLFCNYVKLFQLLMDANKGHLNQKLTYLFYIHEDFFLKNQTLFLKEKGPDNVLGMTFIWATIDAILKIEKNKLLINNIGINTESILLKLLQILKIIQKDDKAVDKERNDHILSELLIRSRKKGESYLKAMYQDFDGTQFVQYNNFLYLLWINSSYINPANPIYKDTSQLVNKKSKNQPQLILPYETNKILGFYTSNMDIEFNERENIVIKPDESSVDNISGFFDPELGQALNNLIEEDWVNYYHPLQPVYLMNPKKDKAFSLHKISPVIFLKANEDQSFWSNVSTATEYAFDIITTASGIGNLAKFRHLARMTKIAKASGQGRKVLLSYQISKGVLASAAFAEITSGTINTLLKITGINDTEFGAALSEFLFWIELVALTGEITNAFRKGVQKNAKILTTEKSDALEKHLDDLVKKGEIDELRKDRIIDDLENLAEKEIKSYKQKLIQLYERGYQYRKVGMPSGQVITKLFTRHGNRIVDSVNRQVKIYTKTLSNAEIRGRVLVSGIGCRKYTKEIILHTNFPKNKLNQFLLNNNILRGETTLKDVKKVYKHLLSEGHIKYDLHPLLEKRIAFHFAELKKGIKHSSNYKWENTGGLPGIHSEILSVNEMLWKIELEQGIKLTDNVFKDMIGFNKHIRYNNPMVRCGDCNFLTYDIPFIEKLLDLK